MMQRNKKVPDFCSLHFLSCKCENGRCFDGMLTGIWGLLLLVACEEGEGQSSMLRQCGDKLETGARLEC